MPLALRPFYPMGQRWPSLELTLQAQVVDPRPEAWLPSPDQGSRLWDGPRPPAPAPGLTFRARKPSCV